MTDNTAKMPFLRHVPHIQLVTVTASLNSLVVLDTKPKVWYVTLRPTEQAPSIDLPRTSLRDDHVTAPGNILEGVPQLSELLQEARL